MKKKIWIIIIFSIFFLVGGFVFITNSFKLDKIETKKYIVVKVADAKYNFPLTFEKLTPIKKILLTFGVKSFLQIKKVVAGRGKNKKELFLDDKLTYDTNLKVIYQTKS